MAELDLGKVVGQGVPAGGTTGQVLQKASATDYDTQWYTPAEATALQISVASFSSLPQTINSAAIKADMRVIACVWGTPGAIDSDVAWTTTDGSLTLSGSINGSTTAEITLIKCRT